MSSPDPVRDVRPQNVDVLESDVSLAQVDWIALVWCPTSSHQKCRSFCRLAALKTLAIPTGIAPVFALPATKNPRSFY
jgi:hypothetical protein